MEAPSILFNWSDFLSDLAPCRRLRSKCQPLPAGHHGFRYSHLTVGTSARLQVNGNTTPPSPQSRVRVRTDFSDNYLRHRSQRISPPCHNEPPVGRSFLQYDVDKMEGVDLPLTLPSAAMHPKRS